MDRFEIKTRLLQRLVIILFWLCLGSGCLLFMITGDAVSLFSSMFKDGLSSSAYSQNKNLQIRSSKVFGPIFETWNSASYRGRFSPDSSIGVIGREGWIWLGNAHVHNYDQGVGRWKLSDTELGNWDRVLTIQKKFLAKRGIPMLFVVAPAKWSIYPEFLPGGVHYSAAKTPFDQLLGADSTGTLVDLRPALRAAKPKGNIYSRLNTHWTDLGAYVGWLELNRRLAQDHPDIGMFAPTFNQQRTLDAGNEYLGMLGIRAINNWDEPIFEQPFAPMTAQNEAGKILQADASRKTDLYELPMKTVNEQAPVKKTLLLMRDSQGNYISPYFQGLFRVTEQVNHLIESGEQQHLPSLVEQIHPDMVIYLVTERYLASPFKDVEYWSALDTYESTASQPTPLPVKDEPGAKTLAMPAGTATRVLRLELSANTWNQASVESGSQVQIFRLRKGENDYYMHVPSNIGQVVVRMPDDAKLRSADIKQVANP